MGNISERRESALEENKKKYILGITGGVGSGKSRILDILRDAYGFHVIQADQVAKDLMMPGMECYDAVVDYLGPAIVGEDKCIDRPVMAGIIFNDPEKRRRVDELTHPLVWKAMLKEAMEADEGNVVMEAAIPSKEFRDKCCEMWYVYTSRENRVERLRLNRGYPKEKSLSIMENQAEEETFRKFCDYIIDNNGSLEQTKVQIEARLKG